MMHLTWILHSYFEHTHELTCNTMSVIHIHINVIGMYRVADKQDSIACNLHGVVNAAIIFQLVNRYPMEPLEDIIT